MEKKFNTIFGVVQVRDIMVDLDGTNLTDGVEITSEDFEIQLEVAGHTTETINETNLQDIIDTNI